MTFATADTLVASFTCVAVLHPAHAFQMKRKEPGLVHDNLVLFFQVSVEQDAVIGLLINKVAYGIAIHTKSQDWPIAHLY